MKKLLIHVCLFFALPFLLVKPTLAAQDASFGAHGMAVFGDGEQLFASHLPMFHAPHDHQLVMQIRLSNSDADASLRASLAREPTLWTIDPEPFALRELWTGARNTFRAKLFQGHFERGGRLVHRRVQVEVIRVVEHRALIPSAACEPSSHYSVLHTQKNLFAFKQIRCKPDFDHLIRLAKVQASGVTRTAKTLLEVRVPHDGCVVPTETALINAFSSAGLQVGGLQTVYFETGDLLCH